MITQAMPYPKLLFVLAIGFLLLSVNEGLAQTIKREKELRSFDVRILTFEASPDVAPDPDAGGDDSEVWEFYGKDLRLVIDFGIYSQNVGKQQDEEDYSERPVIIDNKKATMVFVKSNSASELKYIAAAYFTRIFSDENHLSVVIFCKTKEQQKDAEQILRSIKFKDLGIKNDQ